MMISRFTTVSAAGVSLLAAVWLAAPAEASERADCTATQLDTARRMLRAECGTGVAGSANVFCSWYGTVEIYNVQCGG